MSFQFPNVRLEPSTRLTRARASINSIPICLLVTINSLLPHTIYVSGITMRC